MCLLPITNSEIINIINSLINLSVDYDNITITFIKHILPNYINFSSGIALDKLMIYYLCLEIDEALGSSGLYQFLLRLPRLLKRLCVSVSPIFFFF